jgi:hypothetical protein
MLVVGSKAMVYNYKSLDRKIKDIDIIGNKEDVEYLRQSLKPTTIVNGDGIVSFFRIQNKNEFYNTDNVEILLYDKSEALSEYIKYEESNGKVGGGLFYASPEVLLSLKKSHIHFPVYFKKHIEDYNFLLKQLGEDKLKDITKKNYKETEIRIGKLKTPSLNKSVKDFFGQSDGYVKSYFIHDDMHQAVAHYNEPLYLRMQYDKSLAKCEKVLWDKFPYEDKCKCVLEEAYVIALERKILPSIFGGHKWTSSKEALEWSLMRICTTLCSGWFREFATDNYNKIIEMSNPNYVEDFLTKYNNKEICRMQ